MSVVNGIPLGRPEYLRQQAELSLRRLRLDRIDLYQLHRIDPTVPLPDQIGALRRLQDEGKIRHVGLSEVSVEQLTAAEKITPIVSVQNRYNVTDRAPDAVLEYCQQRGIAFIPWLPVAPVARTAADSVTRIANRLGATRTQVAIARLLHPSPVVLPIPGRLPLITTPTAAEGCDILVAAGPRWPRRSATPSVRPWPPAPSSSLTPCAPTARG